MNPLLNSCECDGSVRFIHYECLKYWLLQKVERRETKTDEGTIVSFSWSHFECELCKHAYPYVFKANNRDYKLADIVDQDMP